MRKLVLATVIVAVTSACGGRDAEPPARVVERFYSARLRSQISGAPSASELAQLAPFLSDTLRALLAAARHRSEEDARRAPDEKAEFVEGDLFSSLFEGPTAFIVDTSSSGDGRVRVRLTRAGENGYPATNWEDRALVANEAGRLVVADIEYGGAWDFANKGTLRTSLERALAPQPR